MTLSTTALAFGNQENQKASAPNAVTLTNSGTASLTLSSIGLTGAHAADFVTAATSSTCTNNQVLVANASCSYRVFFQPGTLGAKSAAVSIAHTGSGGGGTGPVSVALTGTSQATAASTMDTFITSAQNIAVAARTLVENFLAVTYNTFSTFATQRLIKPESPLAPPPASTIVTTGPRNWSDATAGGLWGGMLPVAGAAVEIPANVTVVLDVNTPNLGELTIKGTLVFARQDVELKAKNITITGTGALLAGDAAAPFTDKAIITLTGAKPSFTTGTVPTNTRGITVLNGGKLELYGASPSPVWTQLNAHAQAGTSALTLKDSVDWKAGDAIVVGPSDYYGVNPTERLTLASAAAGTTLATTAALNKFRWGRMQYMTDTGLSLSPGVYTPHVTPAPTQLDQRAAVGNLSRNIVIQGENDSAWQTNGFGAHVMIMGLASKVFVDGVEFRRVGQAGAMARYPIHWHMLSYNVSDGAFLGNATGHEIRNSAIWDSAQRCVVVHGTNGVRVINNICYNIKGHAFFLEDAVERKNVFEGNLALMMRKPKDSDKILNHEGDVGDAGPSGFWMTNPDNTVRNNVAGDAVGNGYWNAFSDSGVGLSRNVVNPDLAGTPWAALKMNPKAMPHGVFDNNVAYATNGSGINTELFLDNSNDLGNTGPDRYRPTVDGRPYDINGQYSAGGITKSTTARATFSRTTIYKTRGGYSNRINAPDYPEWVMSDVAGNYARGAGDDGAFFRGLFIGKSLNDRLGGVNTYPQNAEAQTMFATYHSTFQMRDNTYVNIGYEENASNIERTESGVFQSGDYYVNQMERGTILNANGRFINAFAGARSMPANLLNVNFAAPNRPDLEENYALAGAIWDPHGYWGKKGFYWTFDMPFFTAGGGCQPSLFPTASGKNGLGRYNGQTCPGEYYGVTYDDETDIFRDGSGANAAYWPFDVERTDCNPASFTSASLGKASRACRWVVESGWLSWKLGNMRGASLRQGGKYIMRFPNPPSRSLSNNNATYLPGIKQGTMLNAEGQTVPISISRELTLNFTNVTHASDSFMLAVSFDGSKEPVAVLGRNGGKRYRWLLPPNANPGNVGEPNKARVLQLVASQAEFEADTTGVKMWQDKPNNLVWIRVVGGMPTNAWYRIENFTAPSAQDLYNNLGLYMKDRTIPNQ